MAGPNILYLHSHDTGRYVQPYGYPVPTPNIQHLADQGVLFRQAFAVAPVCSGSVQPAHGSVLARERCMLGLVRGLPAPATPNATSCTSCARRIWVRSGR